MNDNSWTERWIDFRARLDSATSRARTLADLDPTQGMAVQCRNLSTWAQMIGSRCREEAPEVALLDVEEELMAVAEKALCTLQRVCDRLEADR